MKRFILTYFNLRPDQEGVQAIAEDIRQGCEFRGTNLWALIAAIAIASVGLNTNSTAVIIGAMLISPLMGPIIGAGYALSTFDFDLLKTAGRNFLLFVGLSLATSLAFFLISPLYDPTEEILARTYPTIYDVLIAFFGGVAGIVAYTRKDKGGNIIPGVAIATALMPPLCTAGFGCSRLLAGQGKDWYIFAGSLYLFIINSVMIAFATILVTRVVLRIRRKQYPDEAVRLRVTRIIMAAILLTILPSLWLAYSLIGENNYEKSARSFLEKEVETLNIPILKTKVSYPDRTIEIFSLGEPDTLTQLQIRRRTEYYNLSGTRILFRSAREYLVEKERANRTEAENQLLRLRDSVDVLNKKLDEFNRQKARETHILRELNAIDTSIVGFGVSSMRLPGGLADSSLTAVIRCNKPLPAERQQQIQRFLETRLDSARMTISYVIREKK